MLVDSHCHLPLLQREPGGLSAEAAIDLAREAGVGHLLCVCVDLGGFDELHALAQAHPQVSCSVGVHPNSTGVEEPDEDRLVALAAAPDVIAIGETGLDTFRSTGDLGWQHERFRTHIRAARRCGRPLIVHSREAAADVGRILEEESAADVGGVMHCFVDDWGAARRALDMGFYISFSGIVTFRSAAQVQDVARRVPLDRILVETDAPYLAPVPHRGRTNHPAWVRHVAECVAGLRAMPVDDFAHATTENFFRLFPLARRAA
ncbi:MAG: TatD family hydrolase [Gammaproteobacteria bacterium]